jgi:thiamine biosynthesis lipoprotein
VTGLLALALAPSLGRHEFAQAHMGVKVRVVVYAADRALAERAGRAAFARFADLDATLSDWRPDSELNRLCDAADGTPRRASHDLVRVLAHCRRLSVLTEGAFDATVGPAVALWRETRRTGRLPDEGLLRRAMSQVGFRRCSADESSGTVTVAPGTRLDVGGIAKGYACDEALRAIQAEGVQSALVQAGGDLACSAAPPGTRGWVVDGFGERSLVLEHAAVSASGDTEQFVEVGGVRYSHVLDPRTGLGCTSRHRALVVTRRGLDSDPLATALCVLGPEWAEGLGRQFRADCRVWSSQPAL